MPLPVLALPFLGRLIFMVVAAGTVSVLLAKLRNKDPDDPDPPGSPAEVNPRSRKTTV